MRNRSTTVRGRRVRLALAAATTAVGALAATGVGPAVALDCESSDDRSSVQCSHHKGTIEGNRRDTNYRAQPGLSFTIKDKGGDDTLTILAARDEVEIREDGEDLIISYPRGEVRVRNHTGSGELETIEFTQRSRNVNGGGSDRENERGTGGSPGSSSSHGLTGIEPADPDFTDGYMDSLLGRGFEHDRGSSYNDGYHTGCKGCIDV
jgi:hypothetical protein